MAERTYTVPLRPGFWKAPRYRRTNRAVKTLRAFVARHMKVDAESVRIGQHLNEYLWQNGIRNPPPRVKIHVQSKDGLALAELEGKEYTAVERPLDLEEEPQGLKEKLQAAVGGKKDEEKPGENSQAVQDAKDETKEPVPPETADKKPGKHDKKPVEEAKNV